MPLDFDWPLKKVWAGYLMPEDLSLPQCDACDGGGYSPRARELQNVWYGYVPFRPSDNGSTPLTPETPAVRAFAERNVSRDPAYYGRGEYAIQREARRLVDYWNGQWSHHLNTDDVAALVDAGRLRELTHTWVKGDGWTPKVPAVVPTPEQVNEWDILTFGHDAINSWVCVKARCEREGVSDTCSACDGKGDCATDEQRAAYEAWEATEPPTGDGWQLWETTSEGSPASPVFTNGEDLARWMSVNPCGFAGTPIDLATARNWVFGSGWAPSMVAVNGHLMDGITAFNTVEGEVVEATLAIEAAPGGDV